MPSTGCPALLPDEIRLLLEVLSLAGCIIVIFTFRINPALQTFPTKLNTFFAAAVMVGLPPSLVLRESWPAVCEAQALLEQFSSLSSSLWATACLLNTFLVVCAGCALIPPHAILVDPVNFT